MTRAETQELPVPDVQRSFREHEREVRIRTGKIACILVLVLMPLGLTADYFVYPEHLREFAQLRLLCSLLVAGVFLLHNTDLARRFYPAVGMPIVILPAFFMCWIMYCTDDGASSSYYAALNLILLAVSTVGHWSIAETLASVAAVIGLYLATYLATQTRTDFSIFYTNSYFIALTGIISVSGNYLFNRLRYREFVLRCELDANQRKLARQKDELAETVNQLQTTNRQLQQTQAQLVQSEKMASLGRLSAGIIHEINNPLNFATTGLFTLRKKGASLTPEQREHYLEVLGDVEDGLKRVKTIVTGLRTFSHPDTESRDQVEVAEVVASALRFLSAEIKDKVEVECDLADQQTIWANQNQLIQILLNLVQNSLDSLKAKSFANGQPRRIRIEGRVENGKSLLRVRDNGLGIQPEHLPKVFDPFFTTKDQGEGMGLGLSVCYGMVEQFDGRIFVSWNEPGNGCEFTLEFPAKG
ncbi:MAG TPA: ATP-binding protein [Candidatus Paceibacterota bacterium]|nr:ATP-binding protein [Candidatus Paceibacterota bacterium]